MNDQPISRSIWETDLISVTPSLPVAVRIPNTMNKPHYLRAFEPTRHLRMGLYVHSAIPKEPQQKFPYDGYYPLHRTRNLFTTPSKPTERELAEEAVRYEDHIRKTRIYQVGKSWQPACSMYLEFGAWWLRNLEPIFIR